MRNVTTIEISLKSILLVIGTLLLLLIAWNIRGVLIALFVAYILMSGFAPLVDWLVKRGVNKTLSVTTTYFLAIGFFAILLFAVIPPLVREIRDFANNLPVYVNWLSATFSNSNVPGITTDNLTKLVSSKFDVALSNLLGVALNAFSIFLLFIAVAVFAFYLLLEREKIKKNLYLLLPHLPKERVDTLAYKIELKLGSWVRGELVLMLIIGVATYIGLTLLRVEFALPLAVIAGLLEIVPNFGPTISAIPAIIIAFVQAPILAVGVLALYILIQQLENNFIVPKLMEKAVGLSPLVIIFALLVGGSIFGVIGALLAVPAAAIVHVILEDHFEATKQR
ncbi:MAG TPA: AI-2E family transporter [Candidatus Nanoarchaeia archaeon]